MARTALASQMKRRLYILPEFAAQHEKARQEQRSVDRAAHLKAEQFLFKAQPSRVSDLDLSQPTQVVGVARRRESLI